MRLLSAAMLALTISSCVPGQTYTIQTFAGGGLPVNIPATSAVLQQPVSIAVDAAGNLFFAVANHAVLRSDAITGVLTVVAGNGAAGFSGDNGPATSAQLNTPLGVAVDSAGNLYIADLNNNRIRKVSNGTITTVAGSGAPLAGGFSGDNGPATSARLNFPDGVAVDAAGELFIADTANSRVRKVSNGAITTVAGNGTAGYSGDNGLAASAELNAPIAVTVDAAGNLYIADTGNNRVRKVSNGVIETVAGNGTAGYVGDNGPPTSAQLDLPRGVAVDSEGDLYIADTGNNSVRKVSNGLVTTVAGNGTSGYSGDNGPATSAQLSYPVAVAADSAGNLYIADDFNGRIRKVSNGQIGTVAGDGTAGSTGDDGPATSGQLWNPWDAVTDSAGSLYIADTYNNRIRKVSNGVITTVAGNGTPGYGGDNGPATGAQLWDPAAVALDSAGNLYIADNANNRIREVSNGVITTVAGDGTPGYGGDNGPATSAQLSHPGGVAVDSGGDLYIADNGNNRIRRVSNGLLATVAGNGTQGYSGDGGPATSAELYYPNHIAVDSAGDLYIADSGNNRIREVSNGVITTVAGNGTQGYSGDGGPATSAQLEDPEGVAVDSAGNLYIADTDNQVIRKVSNDLIATVAGIRNPGFSGDDGPAIGAELFVPSGVAVDAAGSVYIADTRNGRIRVLAPAGAACTYALSAGGQSFPAAGGAGSVGVVAGSGCQWSASSAANWITFVGGASGTGNGSVAYQVAANGSGSRSGILNVAGLPFTVQETAPLVVATSATLLSGFTGGAYAQDLSATGGVNPYTWTLLSGPLPAGLAISGAAIAGTPTTAGTFRFTLQVADAVGDSASQAFSLTVVSGGDSSALSRVGVLSQFAAGGGYITAIWIVNTSSPPASIPVRLIFHADDGTLVLKDGSGNVTPTPFTVSQQGDTQSGIIATTLDRVLNPNTGLIITCGSGQSDNVQGWVDVLATAAGVSGFAVFTYAATGMNPAVPGFVTPWEGTVPLQSQLTPTTMVLPFDNTNGFSNGVAIGNLTAAPATITATFYDINGGSTLGPPETLTPLAGNGHTSFMLDTRFPSTANQKGTVVFTGTTLMGLGLRASPYDTLTSVPAILQ